MNVVLEIILWLYLSAALGLAFVGFVVLVTLAYISLKEALRRLPNEKQ